MPSFFWYYAKLVLLAFGVPRYNLVSKTSHDLVGIR